MLSPMRKISAILAVAGAVVAGWQLAGPAADADDAAAGAPTPSVEAAALYDRLCLACHGEKGDGLGPGAPWLWPRPRDFTRGEMKWRSTDSGKPATDHDIATAIRYGVPGTAMHAFGPNLTGAQINDLVAVVKGFAPDVYRTPAEVLPTAPRPAFTDELRARGKAKFAEYGCTQCHGDGLLGDGTSAKTLQDAKGMPAPPYDLTRMPLRRPRPAAQSAGDDGAAAIYKSLLTGLTGTSMPSYKVLPGDDLWAIAAYVDAERWKGPAPDRHNTLTDPIAIDLDRKGRLTTTGYWPGNGSDDETRVWGKVVPLQGEPPANLAPVQASLSAQQCARCHMKQVREWRGSLHAGAASPGLMAQLIRQARNAPWVESCQRCHNPLAEQLPLIRPAHAGGDPADRRYKKNPLLDDQLRHEGINCASCHVRDWERSGPPLPRDNRLLSIPGYPSKVVPIYERADFCLACHQLPARTSVNGRPLLNTYREWLEGPYMARGIQCQHCHMPDREHTFKGIHDPDTFRQGIKLETIAGRSTSGSVSVRARLSNVGAGHYLPTTPTPAVWLDVQLVDADGKAVRGAKKSKRIGRHLVSSGGWREIEDTRIPPGESIELAAAWKNGRVSAATHAKVTVRVHPDDFYEGLYESRLKLNLTAEVRAMFREALRRGRASHFVALERLVPIE